MIIFTIIQIRDKTENFFVLLRLIRELKWNQNSKDGLTELKSKK